MRGEASQTSPTQAGRLADGIPGSSDALNQKGCNGFFLLTLSILGLIGWLHAVLGRWFDVYFGDVVCRPTLRGGCRSRPGVLPPVRAST